MKKGGNMKFKLNPFQLYPIRENQLDNLYIDRKKEIELIESILDTAFEKPDEVLPVLGEQGSGKSSTLNYIQYLAQKKGYNVASYTTDDEYLSPDAYSNHHVVLIDNLDKANTEDLLDFYRKVEELIVNTKFIFFTERYNRAEEILQKRQSAISQKIPLQHLDTGKLTEILKKRLKNCKKEKSEFEFPFTTDAMKLASQRASNNLRAFIKYSKNAWTLASDQDNIDQEDMKEGIIMEDKTYLKPLSEDELKVIWYSTIGDFNMGYMSNLCNMSNQTLSKKIENSKLLFKERSGMETKVNSLYKKLPRGEEILRTMIDDLGVKFDEISEEEKNS